MARQTVDQKLAILSDAAKYDASCASSGSTKRDSRDGKGLGSNEGSGICHAYAPDGRCISLLKILMTNFCIYDCSYCINRASSNVARARFSVDEVVKLTIEFYRRNYIEGLFLSSGVIGLAGPKLHIWAFGGTFMDRRAPLHSLCTVPHLRPET
tara:strand:- start:81 stop:542 length:462 start_codon:yes stop_codon:yes gene_type:complete